LGERRPLAGARGKEKKRSSTKEEAARTASIAINPPGKQVL
jgi:hypothetical protein